VQHTEVCTQIQPVKQENKNKKYECTTQEARAVKQSSSLGLKTDNNLNL